jgi:hypothetical protein
MASIRQTWRNPLARAGDRAEATARALLTILWLCTLPLAAVLGSVAWQQASTTAEFQQRTRSATTAELLADAPDIAVDDQGMFVDQQLRVAARWVALDGSERTGVVTTAAGGHTGDRIQIWVDKAGEATSPPVNGTASAVLIVTLTIGLALAWGGVLAGAQYVLRRRLDRRRMAGWDDEWARIGPLWSGRSGGGNSQT